MDTKTGYLLTTVLLIVSFLLLMTACRVDDSAESLRTSEPVKTTETFTPLVIETPVPLATPYAQVPVAGICAEVLNEDTAVVEIWPDVPMPRCLVVRPDQFLQVVNRTDAIIMVSLGRFTGQVKPGAAFAFEEPFGSYLEPGVHRLDVSSHRGPELVLVEG